MIHRVIYGSIERFFGILTEHFAGKFPLWLAPVQAELLPINDEMAPYANEIHATLQKPQVFGPKSTAAPRASIKKSERRSSIRFR